MVLPALPVILSFLVPYVLPIIESTVVDRLAKFGHDTDWAKVKTDINRKVRTVLPDAIFSPAVEDAVVLYVDQRISAFAQALGDTDTEKAVLDALIKGDTTVAWKILVAKVAPHVGAA